MLFNLLNNMNSCIWFRSDIEDKDNHTQHVQKNPATHAAKIRYANIILFEAFLVDCLRYQIFCSSTNHLFPCG
ncbi:unnamed protein product [Schistosoma turkestanicum]|nr:unnamed protein product [Schistosoma turkestanicum]